jgi:hypothetical protein
MTAAASAGYVWHFVIFSASVFGAVEAATMKRRTK